MNCLIPIALVAIALICILLLQKLQTVPRGATVPRTANTMIAVVIALGTIIMLIACQVMWTGGL